jgi:hypothetical protein
MAFIESARGSAVDVNRKPCVKGLLSNDGIPITQPFSNNYPGVEC